MDKIAKVVVMSLRDALNLFPHSTISSDGQLNIMSGDINKGICPREFFGKTFLVNERESGNSLVIGEYTINKLVWSSRMQYVPSAIYTIIKEWELQE